MEAKKRGRKPVNDKTKAVRIYIKESAIKALGGYDEVGKLMYSTISRKLNRISNVSK